MKIILLFSILLYSLTGLAKTEIHGKNNLEKTKRGTAIFGPTRPLNHPSYPSSGSTKYRSKDITGEGTGTSLMSTDAPVKVPDRHPSSRKPSTQQSQEESIERGPYKNGKYLYQDQ